MSAQPTEAEIVYQTGGSPVDRSDPIDAVRVGFTVKQTR